MKNQLAPARPRATRGRDHFNTDPDDFTVPRRARQFRSFDHSEKAEGAE